MTLDSAFASDAQRALLALRQRGMLASTELQALLAKSQPTVSRLMAGLPSQVIVLGSDPATGALDLTPIELAARPVAFDFWRRVAECDALSRGFRALAREMARRVG